MKRATRLFGLLGPSLVTGASDDDPSGIATYSQAGAQFGYAASWTLLLTYPLMVAIQIISARIGRTSGRGIAGNIVRRYPTWVVFCTTTPLLVANVINIGADLGAMGDAVRLLVGGSSLIYVVGFSAVCVALQVGLKYKRYVSVLKWLTLALLAYVATLFVVKVDWIALAESLVAPKISADSAYLSVIVAIFGTTISPYLFYWHASQEVEDLKENPLADPLVVAAQQAESARERIQLDIGRDGLFQHRCVGDHDDDGGYASCRRDHEYLKFGRRGESPRTGRRSVCKVYLRRRHHRHWAAGGSVLAGSAAYAIGEARRWPVGLSRQPLEAKAFYFTVAVATVVGMGLSGSGRNGSRQDEAGRRFNKLRISLQGEGIWRFGQREGFAMERRCE